MNKQIHIATGLTLGIVLSSKLQPALELSSLQYLLCISTTTIGSILPDIDTPYSYLGRRLKLISIPIYKIFGHRTITHSLLLWTILLLASPVFNRGLNYGIFCISLYGGVVLHLVLDTISTVGVCLLYPVCDIRFHLLPRLKGRNRAFKAMYKKYNHSTKKCKPNY